MDYMYEDFIDSYDDTIYPAYEGVREFASNIGKSILKIVAKIRQVVRNIISRITAKNFYASEKVAVAFKFLMRNTKDALNDDLSPDEAKEFVEKMFKTKYFVDLYEVPRNRGWSERDLLEYAQGKKDISRVVEGTSKQMYSMMKEVNDMMYDVEKQYANSNISKETLTAKTFLLNFMYELVVKFNQVSIRANMGAVSDLDGYFDNSYESYMDFNYYDDFALESGFKDFGSGLIKRVKNLISRLKLIVRDMISKLQSGDYTAPVSVSKAFSALEGNVNNALSTREDLTVTDANELVEKWKASSAYRILSEPKEPSKFAALFRTPQEAQMSAKQMFASLHHINKLMYSFEVDFNSGKISEGVLQYNLVLLTFLYKINIEVKGNMRKFHLKKENEQKQKLQEKANRQKEIAKKKTQREAERKKAIAQKQKQKPKHA